MVKARKTSHGPGRDPNLRKADVGETVHPELCRRCAVPDSESVHGNCELCGRLAFQETILCDLNQSVQNRDRFTCYAFRSISKLRLTSARSAKDAIAGQGPGITCGGDDTLLSSDRFKYRHTLMVQRVRSNPDTVYLDIKYHLTWNVARRKPFFVRPADTRDTIDNAFSACSNRIGGFASVLWLAPDHIHVYVDSDGEESIEAIARELKLVSASALREEFNSKGLLSRRSRQVWDRAYFAETIG